MIGATELLYFTNPIPETIHSKEVKPGTKALVTAYITERTSHKRGDFVELTQVVTDRSSYQMVDQYGYYFVGHPLNSFSPVTSLGDYRIAFVTQTLAALVSVSRRTRDNTAVMGTPVRWSDGLDRKHANGVFPMTAPAADWATELWPEHTDTEAEAKAKVLLAKEKWLDDSRKLEILREGVRRNWLADLDKIRAKGHKFPHPTFDLHTRGVALVRTVAPTKAAMTKVQTKLENRGSGIKAEQLQGNPAYITYPVDELLPVNLTTTELANLTPSTVTAHVRDKLNDWEVEYMPQVNSPILSGFRKSR